MNQTLEDILTSFEQLSEPEKWDIALEILKRTLSFNFPPFTDEELVQNAEELFIELDRGDSAPPYQSV